MGKGPTSPILEQIRRAVEDERTRPRIDENLPAPFTSPRDEPACHALLRRHGPMVLDVCRCALGNEADADCRRESCARRSLPG